MSSAPCNPPSRPELIAWEIADEQVDMHATTRADESEIIEAIAGFGHGQQVVLTGADVLDSESLRSTIIEADQAGLKCALSPSDPRTFDRTTLRALVAAGLDAIVLTLDGPDRSSHDAIHGGQGRFDATIRLARWATELGLPIWIRTNVDQLTESRIEHIAARVLALGAVRWSLSFVVSGDDGLAVPELVPNEAERLLRWIADIDTTSELEIIIIQAPMYQRILLDEHGGDIAGRSLVAGQNMLYIDHEGTIAPAGSMPIELGQIPEDDPVRVYTTDPLVQGLRDRSNRQGKCGICEFSQVCGGSRARAFAHLGDPLEQDPLCPYVPTLLVDRY